MWSDKWSRVEIGASCDSEAWSSDSLQSRVETHPPPQPNGADGETTKPLFRKEVPLPPLPRQPTGPRHRCARATGEARKASHQRKIPPNLTSSRSTPSANESTSDKEPSRIRAMRRRGTGPARGREACMSWRVEKPTRLGLWLGEWRCLVVCPLR